MTQPPPHVLPPGLASDLAEVAASADVVVLHEPGPDVLEAYALDGRVGVVAVVAGSPEERARALEAGAIEVVDPAASEVEARARVQTAVARFRSRLHLELTRDGLAQQSHVRESDLRVAARLQRSLLPRTLPAAPGYRFTTAYLPREFVSGDTFEARDVRGLGSEQVVLYTLDAMGHGVRAALLTVLLRQAIRPVERGPDGERLVPPHRVLEDLDRAVREADLAESPTAAACYALLDVRRRRLSVANAGHPLPVRLRRGGQVDPIGGSGLLLGVDPERYETVEVDLAPGDRVFLFTDGAEPSYGGGFVAQLVAHRDLSLEDQLGGALGAAVPLDPDGRPEDDVTVVAFEVLESP